MPTVTAAQMASRRRIADMTERITDVVMVANELDPETLAVEILAALAQVQARVVAEILKQEHGG